VNTDGLPRLEFAAPRLLYTVDTDDPAIPANVQNRAWISPGLVQRARRIRTEVDTQIDLAAYAFSVRWPFPNMVTLSKATPSQRERFLRLAEDYAAKNPIAFPILGDRDIEQRCRLAQIRGVEARMDTVSDKTGAYLHLAGLYLDLGMIPEAVTSYRKTLELRPDSTEALNGLAWRLAIHRQADFFNPQQAIELAERGCKQIHDTSAKLMDTLAAAYAAAGQYDKAQETAKKALELCASTKQTDRAKVIEARLRLYAAGHPYEEPLPVAWRP
jgi:tetratricopeptide (TPR) repeat protein